MNEFQWHLVRFSFVTTLVLLVLLTARAVVGLRLDLFELQSHDCEVETGLVVQ